MAMNTSEAAVSAKNNNTDKNNNTENQLIPGPPYLSAALTRLIGSYLDNLDDLEEFARAILTLPHFTSGACDDDKLNILRKIIREELLLRIFNAVPKEMEEFLKQQRLKPETTAKMLLTKTGFDEGYFSDSLNKFVCFRSWGNVSAVTAPAYVGDLFFLVLYVLAPLLEADKGRALSSEEDSYRFQAMRQLQEVEKRITAQTIKDFTLLSEATNAIVNKLFGKEYDVILAAERELEKLRKSEEFKRLIEDQSIVEEARASGFKPYTDKIIPSVNKTEETSSIDIDLKASSERKIQAERAPIQYAEDAEFLTPVLRLLKAYLNFIIKLPELARAIKWHEIDYLWGIICECLKRLPHNIKQEYFDPEKPFRDATPVDFNREPKRDPCIYSNRERLNLDSIGIDSHRAFNKFFVNVGLVYQGNVTGDFLESNLGAITPYFEFRRNETTGLKYIIEQLKKPETAEALVVKYANNERRQKKLDTCLRQATPCQ